MTQVTMYEIAVDEVILTSAKGKEKILSKGSLVMCDRISRGRCIITSLDGKYTTTSDIKTVKKCPCTCKENEILVAVMNSGYHEYMAIGKNVETLAKHIAEMYSTNCGVKKRKSFISIVHDEYGDEYSITIYKAPIDQLFFDDEYFGPHEKGFVEIGDFLSKYHKTPTSKKDYFYNKKW